MNQEKQNIFESLKCSKDSKQDIINLLGEHSFPENIVLFIPLFFTGSSQEFQQLSSILLKIS
jgi:hypothetical protein